MNKNFITGLAALTAFVMVFSACQKEEKTTEVKESISSEPQKIVFWHSMSEEAGEILEVVVEDFNNKLGKEKKITLEAIYQGSYTDGATKLNTITQSEQYEELPNIMQIDSQGIVTYNSCEKKYSIDEALKKDTDFELSKYIPVALEAWNFQGVQSGLPFASSTTIMYYNKTLLDEAGYSDAPTTFEEMVELSKKLPRKTESGDSLFAYGKVPNSPDMANWIGQMHSGAKKTTYLTDNMNGRNGIATTLTCGTDGSLVTFLEEWKNMYDAGTILNQGFGLSDVFVAGQIACISGSSSSLNSLLGMIGDHFELGVAYLPRVNEQCNFGATVSGSGIFMFDKEDDAQNTAAWEVVKYMTSAETQARISAATGYFPCNSASMDTVTMKDYISANPLIEVSMKQVLMTPKDMVGIIVGPSYEVYSEFMNVIGDGVESGASALEMAETITTDINGYLVQYLNSNS